MTDKSKTRIFKEIELHQVKDLKSGLIFGVKKAFDCQVYFSQRVTGMRAQSQGYITNIAGGGFIDSLEEGDLLSVWVSASNTGTMTISNANLGLEMAVHSTLKV